MSTGATTAIVIGLNILLAVGSYALGAFVRKNAWKREDQGLARERVAQFDAFLATTETGRQYLAHLKERER